MKEFAYLHCHTKYSIQDAMPSCKEYVDAIYRLNQRKIKGYVCKGWAATDHGVIYAFPKMYDACVNPDHKERAIKPVYGCEVYMCDDIDNNPNNDRFHLILLAASQEGLSNLYQIASFAGLHPAKGRVKNFPLVDLKFMEKHGKGLICLTACVAGVVPQCILNKDMKQAAWYVDKFRDIFDDVYIEVQPHEFPEQMLANIGLVMLAEKMGVKLVMTADSHYINKEDKQYQDILKSMSHQKPFNSYNYLYTPEEMEDYCRIHKIPLEAITNTAKVYDRCCNVDLKPDKDFFPKFPCPKGYDENAYLRKLCFEGLQKKIVSNHVNNVNKYLNQLLYELDVICSMGFAGYFLILWDWFAWCRKQGILTGPGRGSAAGSIISYLLNITKVDPIKNGFIFERFMSPLRREPPDIDTDIPRDRRAEAIRYLLNKYGKENVCQIITFGEYKLKNTTKAIMSSLGVPFTEQNEVTRDIPDLIDGKPVTYELIEGVHNNPEDPKYASFTEKEVSKLNSIYDKYQEVFRKYPQVYQGIKHICGCIANTGLHAGGVIISRYPLAPNVGLIDGGDTAVLPLVQVEMTDMDFYGLLKIDALGLKTLDVIKKTMDLTGLGYDWYDSEDYTDKDVYDMLRSGNTCDVFQFSSFQPTKMIADFDCHTIESLSAVNAGNRPGPLEKNPDTGKSMVDLYVEYTKQNTYEHYHPNIDVLLKETRGLPWYQENLISIGLVMAGYDMGGADQRIRKVLGKKKIKMIPEIRNEFIYGKKSLYDEDHNVIGVSDEDSPWCVGSIARGYTEVLSNQIFDIMAAFAKYSFNKSHSFCYSVLGYKEAWLAYHYPVEFAVANCSINKDQQDIVKTLTNAKKKGIKVLPPDINRSETGFSIDNGCIRYGLAAIKGLGSAAIGFLEKYREKSGIPFTSFNDFYKRIHDTSDPIIKNMIADIRKETGKNSTNPIKKDVEVALIMSGVFDEMEPNRFVVLNEYAALRKDKTEKVCGKDLQMPQDPAKYQRKQKLAAEMYYMGGYISEHPLDPFPYEDFDAIPDGEKIKTTAIVLGITKKKTKRGKDYYTVEFACKDDIPRKGNVFDDKPIEIIRQQVKKNQIVTVRGTVNHTYNNVNITSVVPVQFKKQVVDTEDIEIEDKSKPVITPVKPVEFAEV